MTQEKEKINMPEESKEPAPQPAIKRRALLKAMAGLPIAGLFAYELIEKKGYDLDKKTRVLKELDYRNWKPRIS